MSSKGIAGRTFSGLCRVIELVRPLVRRRAIKMALLVAGLFAGWVASAGADIPPLPTVPTLPQVPTLPPIVPPAPHPPQVPPVQVPQAPQVPPVSRPALPVGGGSSGGSGGTSSSGGGSSAGTNSRGASGHSDSRPARVYRLHFSRNWISRTGAKQRRQTVIVFTLRNAGVVEFVVNQVAPDCRRIGRFRVSGQTGVNYVRFRGHIGRGVLPPGTYRIVARTLPGGRSLVDTKLVVVARPNSEDIAAAQGANVCGSEGGAQSTSSSTGGGASGATGGSAANSAPAKDSAEKRARAPRAHGVLGARFTKPATAVVDAVKSVPIWLFILLGLAIALLAVAALPLRAAPTRRGASTLAHRRGIFALAGAAALVAVTVAYALH